MDPAFRQLHLHVCIMIELRNYAMTDKVIALFQLCKGMLERKIADFPVAHDVIQMYLKVKDPHSMGSDLCKTNYTDEFVNDVNGIIEIILAEENADAMLKSFEQLTNLTGN